MLIVWVYLHSNVCGGLRNTHVFSNRVHNGPSRSSKVVDYGTNGKHVRDVGVYAITAIESNLATKICVADALFLSGSWASCEKTKKLGFLKPNSTALKGCNAWTILLLLPKHPSRSYIILPTACASLTRYANNTCNCIDTCHHSSSQQIKISCKITYKITLQSASQKRVHL